MCGIVGFSGDKNFKELDNLLAGIEHRGRDERVMKYVGGMNIGMNRLSINDLKIGLFPFKYKKYTLIFNGEIYNYKELKEILSKKNIELKSGCDAEVILPLYDLYGFDFLKYIEGMFAICIVDEKKNIVFLARDRMGEKPMYYSIQDKELIFGSELKIFNGGIAKIKKEVLAEYFYNGFVSNGKTLIEGINKVPLSHYLIYDLESKETRLQKYWSLEIKKSNDTEDKLVDNLSNFLKISVEKRLLADVEVGSFLSGGIDSSLITYFASQKIKNMPVFSVTFPGFNDHDELKYSIEVSKKLNLKQEIVECGSVQTREVIMNLGNLVDEPIVDPALIPTFLLAQRARKSVKVVLTGEGADELFCGYKRYDKELKINKIRQCLKWARQVKGVVPDRYKKLFVDLGSYYSTQKIWNSGEIEHLIGEKYLVKNDLFLRNIFKNDLLLGMQIKDLNGYLPENLFMKVDKMTMQNNLEARAPFVDEKIVEFALGLDQRYKVRNGQGKYILKKMAEKYFDKEFVWREKHGLSLPLKEWFLTDLKDIVFDSLKLSEKYSDLVNIDFYKEVVDEHMKKNIDNSDKIWSMIVLLSWIDKRE